MNYTAFAGMHRIVSGDVETMLLRTKERMDAGETETILIFEDETGKQVDFDFRGTPEEVLGRLTSHPLFQPPETLSPVRSGPGRPGLGVVCREVSLLPRHWDWLGQQPGSVSATLRKLVDAERKRMTGKDGARQAWEAAGKFMWVMGGNLPGFEEASRALFAKNPALLDQLIEAWPVDIREHLQRLVRESVRLDQEAATTPGDGV